jgi:hypothetical protein
MQIAVVPWSPAAGQAARDQVRCHTHEMMPRCYWVRKGPIRETSRCRYLTFQSLPTTPSQSPYRGMFGQNIKIPHSGGFGLIFPFAQPNTQVSLYFSRRYSTITCNIHYYKTL